MSTKLIRRERASTFGELTLAQTAEGCDADELIANSELDDQFIGVARLLAYLASNDSDDVRRNLFTR